MKKILKDDEKKIYSMEELISPFTATTWLQQNTNNRRVSKVIVDRYAKAMSNGEWKSNGQAIIFNKEGKLIDGQHRLSAIVKSGVFVKMLVTRDVEDDAFDTIDIGKVRRNSDFLYIKGFKYQSCLAAAVKILYNYDAEQYITHNEGGTSPSPAELFKIIEDNPGIFNSVSFCHNLPNRSVLGPSTAAGLHYVFSRIDIEKADEFFNKLYRGDGLSSGSPILALRNKMMAYRGALPRKKIVIAMIIKTWNLWRRGKTRQAITWNADEPFPVAR